MGSLDGFMTEAEAAVLEAGRYLKENLNARTEIVYKGDVDLVTKFDMEAQDLVSGRLLSAFPDHGILAEEGLCREGQSEFRWILDPLDGTTNFAHGFPVYSVSLALERKGNVVLGIVYDPMREEIFRAEAGKGATRNGNTIQVSNIKTLGESLLATGFPYDVRTGPVNNLDHWNHFVVEAQAIRRCGSAALDLCYVACGRFDGFWELKLNPWDVAAGTLIVVEAGGRISDFRGQSFSIFDPETLATNGFIHEAMIDVLKKGRKPKDA